jgi:hypothetical protein
MCRRCMRALMILRKTDKPRLGKGETSHSVEDLYVLGRQENDL